MNNDLNVSVIIPTYNRKKDLEVCLDSLLHQDTSLSNFEVVVIDDGSNDNTEELFIPSDRWKALQIVYSKQERMGTPSAMNKGIRMARGKILAFIDSDCIAARDWIKNTIYYHEKFQDIMAIQGRILNTHKRRFAAIVEQEIYEAYLNYLISENGEQKIITNLFTGNCSIKMEAFKEMGCSFSEEMFFGYGCDIDIAMQILNKGKKNIYIDDVVVEHKNRPDIFSYMRRCFIIGRFEYLLKAKWKINRRDYETKEFKQLDFTKALFLNFLSKYKGRVIILFNICILRKVARILGYFYEKNIKRHYENIKL